MINTMKVANISLFPEDIRGKFMNLFNNVIDHYGNETFLVYNMADIEYEREFFETELSQDEIDIHEFLTQNNVEKDEDILILLSW